MNQTERTVTVQGNAEQTVIITGDGNRVALGHSGEFAFRLLDEDFRRQQANRTPADFYNGTRPNWANIARATTPAATCLTRCGTSSPPPARRSCRGAHRPLRRGQDHPADAPGMGGGRGRLPRALAALRHGQHAL